MISKTKIYNYDQIQKVYKRHFYHPGTVLYSDDQGITWKSTPVDAGKWNINSWLFSFIEIEKKKIPKKVRHGHVDGACCCNCQFLFKLNSHPVVDGKSIMNNIGYICTVYTHPMMGEERTAMIIHQHGMCELHTPLNT